MLLGNRAGRALAADDFSAAEALFAIGATEWRRGVQIHHLTYGRYLLFMSDRNLQSLLGFLAGVGSLMFTDVCS